MTSACACTSALPDLKNLAAPCTRHWLITSSFDSFLWFIFSLEKYWVPPKDFGYMIFDFMDTATVEYSLLENYFLMFYHATFVFNMVDVTPRTYISITAITIILVISAFANALLYGTFFSLRQQQNSRS